MQGPRIAKTTLIKDKVVGITLPDFKTLKIILDQWKKIESRNEFLHMVKHFQGERGNEEICEVRQRLLKYDTISTYPQRKVDKLDSIEIKTSYSFKGIVKRKDKTRTGRKYLQITLLTTCISNI